MVKKKLTVMIDESIYDAFAGKCKSNNFKISEVIIACVTECDSLIDIAKAKREKIAREAMEAQILQLTEKLGYTESDVKKLLKNSKPAEVKPTKEEEGNESMHRVHTFDASKPAGSTRFHRVDVPVFTGFFVAWERRERCRERDVKV